MITEKQKQILKALINEKEGCNINQIAKITKLSLSWTYETLKFLESQEFLISVKSGNAILFKINWKNPKAQKIVEFIEIEESYNKKQYTIEIRENLESKKLAMDSSPVNFYSQNNQKQNIKSNPYLTNQTTQGFSYSQVQQQNFSYSPNIQTGSFYGIAPIGPQGVNAVLTQYAASGALGSFSYASSQANYNQTQLVPPATLGSKVSGNISGFTLGDHTSTHVNNITPGCRYCGPEIKIV